MGADAKPVAEQARTLPLREFVNRHFIVRALGLNYEEMFSAEKSAVTRLVKYVNTSYVNRCPEMTVGQFLDCIQEDLVNGEGALRFEGVRYCSNASITTLLNLLKRFDLPLQEIQDFMENRLKKPEEPYEFSPEAETLLSELEKK